MPTLKEIQSDLETQTAAVNEWFELNRAPYLAEQERLNDQLGPNKLDPKALSIKTNNLPEVQVLFVIKERLIKDAQFVAELQYTKNGLNVLLSQEAGLSGLDKFRIEKFMTKLERVITTYKAMDFLSVISPVENKRNQVISSLAKKSKSDEFVALSEALGEYSFATKQMEMIANNNRGLLEKNTPLVDEFPVPLGQNAQDGYSAFCSHMIKPVQKIGSSPKVAVKIHHFSSPPFFTD